MSIKTKLISVTALVLILASLCLGSIVYWQNNKILSEHIDTDIENSVNYTSQLVDSYINQIGGNLYSLSVDPLVRSALEARDASAIEAISRKISVIEGVNKSVENIFLMEINDSSCIVRVADQDSGAMIGRDFSSRDYCQGAIKTKEAYLSSAFMSAVNNDPVLGLIMPVKNAQGEMLGFVYAAVNLKDLHGYLFDLQKDSKVELLDRYGTMFLNTDKKITTLSISQNADRFKIVNQVKGGISNNKLEDHFRSGDNFIGYKTNGVVTVVFEKPASSLLVLTKTLNLIIFVSLAITIILVILIIFLFIQKITKKLSRLSEISQNIANGKFDIEIDEKDLNANDETAVLTRSFSAMAKSLKDLYNNLDQKVQERTRKLEKSELFLTKTLNESEKMNKLMVGRELEMIKLKKEIAQFKNQGNK
jgi:C4-dicarboxylate-specific signal transduction histidine kinase